MLIVLSVVEVAVVAAQNQIFDHPGSWRTLTDMRSVRSLSSAQGAIWVASQGGLFRWESQTETTAKYTNSEGLSSNDLTAVMVDPGGRVWVGTSEGSVNVLAPGSSQWTVIDDIRNSGRIQKSIRTFSISGDSLFIGTDFGVSVFRLSRWEFGDTYANFGFASPASVNSIVVTDGLLWIATDQGVARAQRFLTNLSAPTNWTRFQTGQGLPANNATCAAFFHDTLVVGTASGAAFFDGASFQSLLSLAGASIISVVTTSVSLNALVSFSGYEIRSLVALDAVSSSLVGLTDIPTDFAYDSSSSSWYIGTQSNGVVQWGISMRSIIPNGPLGNLFSSLAVDGEGVLWRATGISGQGKGFGRYTPLAAPSEHWKNFTVADNPIMLSNDYYKVGVGSNNRVWVSSWGTGVVEVVADSIRRRLDATSIPALASSVPSGPPFVVVGSVGTDPSGTDWFVNRTAINGNHLAGLVSDSVFSYMTNGITPGQGLFTSMVVDENGSKWLANAEPFNKPATGLYYVNEDLLISGTSSSGGWGLFTVADGLPNNTILSLATDLNGNVCVGTDLGLMIISDPLFPKQRHFTSFPLREQSIQALAIDALNNKWVGTKEGVFVMNADATQILQQYTVTSTGGKLVENDIRALAIDQRRGIVYIGTEKGLSSLSIEAVLPVRSSKDLSIGPNPFTVPSATQLVIGNLVAESSIKILTVDGSVVSEFKAQGGGRAFWNGRDGKGNFVGSGIYFVVAFAQDGDQIATGKIAVIRK